MIKTVLGVCVRNPFDVLERMLNSIVSVSDYRVRFTFLSCDLVLHTLNFKYTVGNGGVNK